MEALENVLAINNLYFVDVDSDIGKYVPARPKQPCSVALLHSGLLIFWEPGMILRLSSVTAANSLHYHPKVTTFNFFTRKQNNTRTSSCPFPPA